MLDIKEEQRMPLPQPLNNNCLIEVQKEYGGVSRADDDETLKTGILQAYSVSPYHFTASTSIVLGDAEITALEPGLKNLVGKTVRWEQYAEGGQTFEQDGKTYALIPWWRLISMEGE